MCLNINTFYLFKYKYKSSKFQKYLNTNPNTLESNFNPFSTSFLNPFSNNFHTLIIIDNTVHTLNNFYNTNDYITVAKKTSLAHQKYGREQHKFFYPEVKDSNFFVLFTRKYLAQNVV